jgi:hypothetical protein
MNPDNNHNITEGNGESPSVAIAIRRSALASLTEAGRAGHWDGAYAASQVTPGELLALRAYFSAAMAAVQEALDRVKIAEAQALRQALRAEKPRARAVDALEEFLRGL